MSTKTINGRLINKHDIESNWLKAENFIPLKGEIIIYDKDENNTYTRIKIGDGVTNVNELPFCRGVGIYTNNGGEIFNDYENNKAINLYSSATGQKTIAGMKGFRITRVDKPNGETQYLYLNRTDGIESGDEVCVKGNFEHISYGVVIAVTETTISLKLNQQYVNIVPSFEILPEEEIIERPWENVLWIEAKPDIGDVDIGIGSFAEGIKNVARRVGSHTEGYGNQSIGFFSHTEGSNNISNYCAHAEGTDTTASGEYSHTEGVKTVARGRISHAEGYLTEASGVHSHAEGSETHALGDNAHTEGYNTTASGIYSHAEGAGSVASGFISHTEGYNTVASEEGSHSEGYGTVASGMYSHAEGHINKVAGYAAHAEGSRNIVNGNYSHVEGVGNQSDSDFQHIQGTNAEIDTEGKYAHIQGGKGIYSGDRYNIHTVDWSGNAWFAGAVECASILMKSPNGTKFKITVDDSGKLTTTLAE